MANRETDKIGATIEGQSTGDTYLLVDHRLPAPAGADAGKLVVATGANTFGLARRSRVAVVALTTISTATTMYADGLTYEELADVDLIVAEFIDNPPANWVSTISFYSTEYQHWDGLWIAYNSTALTPASVSIGDWLLIEVRSWCVLSNSHWYADIAGKQDALVSGTNIKTVNGASLLGSGNIQLGTLFYGTTSTPEATAEKVVELAIPSTGFTDGSYLLLHFYHGVPAGSENTISVEGVSYGLVYHQYMVATAGVINAGDKVLMLCLNSVAQIIAIDRWGADIAGKQDTLVSGTNIKTVNGGSLLGSGNLSLLPKHTPHVTDITTATANLSCPSTERSYHIVNIDDTLQSCTLTVDLQNNVDNTIILQGSINYLVLDLQIDGVPAPVVYEESYFAGKVSGEMRVFLAKSEGIIKLVAEAVEGAVVLDIDNMQSYTPSN